MTALLPLAWAALLLGGAWSVRPSTRVPKASRSPVHVPVVEIISVVAAATMPLAMLPPAAFVAWATPKLRTRHALGRRADDVRRCLPEVVDLFHLAIASGLTVPLAVDAVVRRASGPIVDELAQALAEVALGRRLGDALDDVPARAGEVVRPLTAALVASDRYGAPLAEPLARLAAEVRADRRRLAEEAARKVPVKLLFPLVCCVLPAFGLLTLAPLIAGAASALRL